MNPSHLFAIRPSLLAVAAYSLLLPSTSRAETSQGSSGPRPIFRSTSNLDIDVKNMGADDFLCSWPASIGISPNNIADPHIIIEVGYYLTFFRTSPGHPFFLLSGDMPVATDQAGKLYRTFTDQGTLDSYKLANGNGLPHGNLQDNGVISGGNPIYWEPTVGTYYYTCGVPGHANMVGRIDVVPANSIDHDSYPQPFLELDGKKSIKSRKSSFKISGLTSGTAVTYSYKDGRKNVKKTIVVPSSGQWKKTIKLKTATRKAKIKIYASFNDARSSTSTVRFKKQSK